MHENELKDDGRKMVKKFSKKSVKFSFLYNTLEKGIKN